MENSKPSMKPCPICREMMFVIGKTAKGKKIGSCGCRWHFKKTKSEKDMDRKYIQTDNGLEIKEN